MTEPTRLREDGDPSEVELLASASGDAPSNATARRTLAALGIAAGVTAPSGGAEGASANGAAGGGQAAPASGGLTLSGSSLPWVGLAAVAALLGWAVAGGALEPEPQRLEPIAFPVAGVGPDERTPENPSEPDALAAVPVEETSGFVELGEEGDEPRPARAPDRRALAASPEGPVAAAPSWTLTDEIAALDRARRALEGEPEIALAELAAYRARFPGGALTPEADALRVEALARAGRLAEAKEAAERYGREHPDSPHTERVEAAAE